MAVQAIHALQPIREAFRTVTGAAVFELEYRDRLIQNASRISGSCPKVPTRCDLRVTFTEEKVIEQPAAVLPRLPGISKSWDTSVNPHEFGPLTFRDRTYMWGRRFRTGVCKGLDREVSRRSNLDVV